MKTRNAAGIAVLVALLGCTGDRYWTPLLDGDFDEFGDPPGVADPNIPAPDSLTGDPILGTVPTPPSDLPATSVPDPGITSPEVPGAGDVQLAYELPSSVIEASDALMLRVIDAYFAANHQGGATFGTLTQIGDGWNYTGNEPTDGLRLVYEDETEWDVVLENVEGTMFGGVDTFLTDHRIRFQVSGTTLGVVFEQERASGITEVACSGWMTHDGEIYAIDLVTAAQGSSTTFSGITSTTVDRSISGTIEREDFLMAVAEEWRNTYIDDDTGIFTVRTARTLDSEWVLHGGTTLAFKRAAFAYSLRNGRPVETDNHWRAAGELLINGVAAGDFVMREDHTDFVGEVVNGATRYELDRWFNRFDDVVDGLAWGLPTGTLTPLPPSFSEL